MRKVPNSPIYQSLAATESKFYWNSSYLIFFHSFFTFLYFFYFLLWVIFICAAGERTEIVLAAACLYLSVWVCVCCVFFFAVVVLFWFVFFCLFMFVFVFVFFGGGIFFLFFLYGLDCPRKLTLSLFIFEENCGYFSKLPCLVLPSCR